MSSCLHSATARGAVKLARNAAARAPRGAVPSRALLRRPTFIGNTEPTDRLGSGQPKLPLTVRGRPKQQPMI